MVSPEDRAALKSVPSALISADFLALRDML